MKNFLKKNKRKLNSLDYESDSNLNNLLLEADEYIEYKEALKGDTKKSFLYFGFFGVSLLILDSLMLYFWLSIYFLCGN